MNQPDTINKHAKIHAKFHHLFLALMNHQKIILEQNILRI